MTYFDSHSQPITRRLLDGFNRLMLVLKGDQWDAANATGLNPAQIQVLTFLSGRGTSMKVKELAEHLGVKQPTATDTVAALERKKLVAKQPNPNDARTVSVCITKAGRAAVKVVASSHSVTETAIAALTMSEQADLLLLITKIIRSLQNAGRIPAQRMCVTCKHFRPHVHDAADAPHHCAFVNAAFGAAHLRLDCPEQQPAEAEEQSKNWSVFTKTLNQTSTKEAKR